MTSNYRRLKDLLKEVCRDARVPLDRVVVGGSGVLGMLALRDVRDLDVWVEQEDLRRIRSVYQGNDLDISTGPWIAGDEDFSGCRETVKSSGLRFWNSKKTLRWKRKMRRRKDLEDIRLLEDYLSL